MKRKIYTKNDEMSVFARVEQSFMDDINNETTKPKQPMENQQLSHAWCIIEHQIILSWNRINSILSICGSHSGIK